MFYIFHGDDEFSRAEQIAVFKEKVGDATVRDLNVTQFDARVTFSELRHAADAIPFLADKRLVIVEGLLTRLGESRSKSDKEYLDKLKEYLPFLSDSTRLVFVEPKLLPKNNALLKLAAKQEGKTVLEFVMPKDATQWIGRRVKKHGGEIEPRAAATLARMTGNNLRRLDAEIHKLVTYVDAARPISEDDVTLMVSAAIEANVFALVDALGVRDGKQAMQELHRLIDLGENPLGLLAMITRQFRLLIQVKELMGQSISQAEMAKVLGQHPFVVEKITRQSRNFTMEQLERIYHYLLEMDVAIKTGETGDVLALDLLVVGLAG